uniref:NADH-ubiquinone oxidoreductase chain 1 n=1 Tax=Ecnomus latus TaxID=623472 RepID=A0A9E8LNU0_9NEOP|nr:NADH dehydrogenase subunit 1 [Ecnomus latus]UZZ43908.1 NADH dehydrogenase subunit 1 [Ecnomus latus]
MLMNLIIYLLEIIMILISVAFFTLMERKLLGYIHLRKGPNKVGLIGLFQPFSDAIKLLKKEYFFMFSMNIYIYMFCPLMMLILSLFFWIIYPMIDGFMELNYELLFIMSLLSVSVYSLMMMGWSSNSIYSMLGSFRSVIQSISYEVSMMFLFLVIFIMVMSLNFIDLIIYQSKFMFILILFPLSMMILVSMLAELNRSPFDFVEGESELVSGFNVEFGSGLFTLIFLSEYAMMIFMSFLFSLFFLGFSNIIMLFSFKILFIMLLLVWIRGIMPRYRYDKLMMLTWKTYLLISINYLLLIFSIKCLFWNNFDNFFKMLNI